MEAFKLTIGWSQCINYLITKTQWIWQRWGAGMIQIIKTLKLTIGWRQCINYHDNEKNALDLTMGGGGGGGGGPN